MKQYAKLKTFIFPNREFRVQQDCWGDLYIFVGSESLYLKDRTDIELVPVDSKHYGVFARDIDSGSGVFEYDIVSLHEFDEYALKQTGWYPIIKNETRSTCALWLKENVKREVIYQFDSLLSYNY